MAEREDEVQFAGQTPPIKENAAKLSGSFRTNPLTLDLNKRHILAS
jgi:hypothetical protein